MGQLSSREPSCRDRAPMSVESVRLARHVRRPGSYSVATTSLSHFIFVPLTLGLAPIVAVMQTKSRRSGRRRGSPHALLRHAPLDQLRDRRCDGARAGVPVRDELVGLLGVRRRRLGAPLAIKGLAAFFLEATSSACGSSAGTGFRPASTARSGSLRWAPGLGLLHRDRELLHADAVGYKMSGGIAELSSVEASSTKPFGYYAMIHRPGRPDGGLDAGAGVACWHFGRG